MEKSRGAQWLGAALVAALSLSAFSAAVGFPFAGIDDADYVTGNPHIQQGFTAATMRWAFTRTYAANWFPLTWLSHTLDWTLWGSAPAGHHLSSVLLHAANGALLFLFLLQATRLYWPSLLTAALFAVHPLRVESVVWISERKDVLSAFFFLLMLVAWLGWVRKPGAARYLLVCALFAAGLASKPMLVTAPFVLLLLDVWPLRRPPLLREKLPLFLLSAAASLLTLRAQSSGRAISPLPLSSRIADAIEGYAIYLKMAVWPARLAVHYPLHPEIHWGPLLAAAALLVAITGLCLWQLRERPQLAVGWAWFLVMLLPVIGVVQAGSQSVADRYSYLPLIGPFFALSFSLPRRAALWATAAAAVCALFVLTLRQESYWRDDGALFSHALEVSPDDPLALQALANQRLSQGKLEEAEALYRAVLRQWPTAGRALNARGLIALRRGQPREALRWFEQALAVEPDPTLVAPTMAATLTQLGRTAEAVRLLEPLEPAHPDFPDLQRELGVALAEVGRTDEALAHLLRAQQLAPRDAATQLDLGILLARGARYGEAIERFQRALELDPQLQIARQQLELARRDALHSSKR
ncbi:MAG: tetratricopeptide repeat protein [Deltaproteobacteria bacterium]|nr:MAG: tetratricopeptide repeat protein [Deltaproteobacteria bacterium]